MRYLLILIFILGSSLRFSDKAFQKNWERGLPIDIGSFLRLDFGTNPIYADANAWGFVRQSATWARGNSNLIDLLIAGLKNAGYFNSTAPLSQTLTNIQLDGLGSTTIRLKINQQASPISGITSSAYAGTKAFNHFLELTKTGNASPSLQLFFDDPNTLLGNDGALIYYKLGDFNSPNFANVGSVITESYTANESSYGTKFQSYTWKNGPENATWPSDIGRVVLTEVDSGKQLCFRSVVRMKFSKLVAINPSQTTNLNNLKTVCGGSDQIYYGLAYMQKFASPFYTTAKASISALASNSTFPETICNLSSSISGAKLSYGIFDVNGFVRDGLRADEVPSTYPSPTVGGADFMSVDEAFSRTGIDASSSLGAGKPAARVYEYTSKNFLDSLAGSEGDKINFKTVN
ncbi:hypothetical protein LPTSP4_19990 [Leptospira ryugenii]|uniref:Uncharacterized protein n=1 Tax=Leptospira ryugenii TaxID=1917863 RepID=A0A2P2E0R0_9LEPT|nr:hypothetical protein [Leptospira ryugenii]GBF50474.1 hypothetical protein LPTSP4_19990 [Leptospira ryugenii]